MTPTATGTALQAGLTSGAAQARTGWVIELGADASAARAIQRCAAEAHVSQSAEDRRCAAAWICWAAGSGCAG